MKQTEILTHATHVNGWEPAVYMSCMSQNFRLFHVSNLSVRNFRIFLLMYPGTLFDEVAIRAVTSLPTKHHRLREAMIINASVYCRADHITDTQTQDKVVMGWPDLWNVCKTEKMSPTSRWLPMNMKI